MALYSCDGCSEAIPVLKARIHCEVCVQYYDICANCYILECWTMHHEPFHWTLLHEISGYCPRAPPVPYRPALPIRPAHNNSTASLDTLAGIQSRPVPLDSPAPDLAPTEPLHRHRPQNLLQVVLHGANVQWHGTVQNMGCPYEYYIHLPRC
jgi:hypothetical protein